MLVGIGKNYLKKEINDILKSGRYKKEKKLI